MLPGLTEYSTGAGIRSLGWLPPTSFCPGVQQMMDSSTRHNDKVSVIKCFITRVRLSRKDNKIGKMNIFARVKRIY